MIEKVMVLSTAHMPNDEPEFGSIRHCNHQYGAFVFLGDYESIGGLCPWLKPIVTLAMEKECSMVMFDRDAETVNGLEAWEW